MTAMFVMCKDQMNAMLNPNQTFIESWHSLLQNKLVSMQEELIARRAKAKNLHHKHNLNVTCHGSSNNVSEFIMGGKNSEDVMFEKHGNPCYVLCSIVLFTSYLFSTYYLMYLHIYSLLFFFLSMCYLLVFFLHLYSCSSFSYI